MKMFSDYLEEFENTTQGSYADLILSKASSAKLYKWAIKNNINYPLDSSTYHTTVAYSRKYIPGLEKLNPPLPVKAKAIGWDKFGDNNILVLKLISPTLYTLFNQIIKMGATYDFENYVPHITIAKNYMGPLPEKIPSFVLLFDSYNVEALDLLHESAEPHE